MLLKHNDLHQQHLTFIKKARFLNKERKFRTWTMKKCLHNKISLNQGHSKGRKLAAEVAQNP